MKQDLGKQIEKYEIEMKHSFGTDKIPVLKRWKNPHTNDPFFLDSLDEVRAYLSESFSSEGRWMLEKKTKTKKGTIYTFYSEAHPDSDFARHPGEYLEHYIHIRAKPIYSKKSSCAIIGMLGLFQEP